MPLNPTHMKIGLHFCYLDSLPKVASDWGCAVVSVTHVEFLIINVSLAIDSIPSRHWIGTSMTLTRSLRTFTTNIWRLFNNRVLIMYEKYTKQNPLSRIMCSVASGKSPQQSLQQKTIIRLV